MRARHLDLLHDLRPLDGLELAQVGLELVVALPRHRHALGHARGPPRPRLSGLRQACQRGRCGGGRNRRGILRGMLSSPHVYGVPRGPTGPRPQSAAALGGDRVLRCSRRPRSRGTRWTGRPWAYLDPAAAQPASAGVATSGSGSRARGAVIAVSHVLTSRTRWGAALARELAAGTRPAHARRVRGARRAVRASPRRRSFAARSSRAWAGSPRACCSGSRTSRRAARSGRGPDSRCVAGGMLGALFEATGNLAAPITAHAVHQRREPAAAHSTAAGVAPGLAAYSAIASISIAAPSGSAATCTVARAGGRGRRSGARRPR